MDTSTKKISKDNKNVSTAQEKVENSSWDDEEFQVLLQTLPKETRYGEGLIFYFYQGFWIPSLVLKPVISFQKHFQAVDTDIIVITSPKCGTTWLKALTFFVVNRNKFAKENNPLLSFGPHQLVPFLEFDVYLNNPSPDLENSSIYDHPRLFSTHVPYPSLPNSIKDSNSKIVYLCRNPMDMFISLWFFTNKVVVEPLSLDEAFELFCQGKIVCGPFFDHVLGYWKASQENPNKILFLRYEDVMEDTISHLKKIATFLGFPFSEEEERQGRVEEIAKTCSFANLKELDVNKSGVNKLGIPCNSLFRKAEVGDWKNYLTPEMVKRLEKLIKENFDKSGLTFKLSFKTQN